MTSKSVSPAGAVHGRVSVPGDKSISHRAVILAARLEGDAALSRRPMDRVIDPLSKMGAFFFTAPGLRPGADDGPAHLPLRMRGTHSVRPLQWKSPVASAQVKSAILLAGLYAS